MKQYFRYSIILLLIAVVAGCKSVANFPISAPSSTDREDRIAGRWKLTEDTNKNNFFAIEKGNDYNPDKYHVQFWNKGGTNPTYEVEAYFSKIGNSMFLNVPYPEKGMEKRGYFFLKILDANADYTKITTATVHDTTLRSLKNEREVLKLITENIDNPAFYYDTCHFYKLK